MISCFGIGSGGGAATYHDKSLSVSDSHSHADNYYATDIAPSAWGGAAAEYAGLQIGQSVTREAFVAALDGHLLNRQTGENQQLGRKQGDEIQHRSGWDFTYSAPKSVSLVGLIGEDPRVVKAHEQAVNASMDYLEKHAAYTKVNNKGDTLRIKTDNLLYAKFHHETSRANDPQLHTHVVIANATYDQERGRWGSLANEKLF